MGGAVYLRKCRRRVGRSRTDSGDVARDVPETWLELHRKTSPAVRDDELAGFPVNGTAKIEVGASRLVAYDEIAGGIVCDDVRHDAGNREINRSRSGSAEELVEPGRRRDRAFSIGGADAKRENCQGCG